ncbi:MAG: copper transporter [Coriobacteriia bacterium]|nr:copper transporter [Coriobacteriia bacterium]
MYNFRYHLVTIVSIFASLLVGLLLGAAIAGSDIVRNTSNEMLDSLLARFDDLTARNASLRGRLTSESALAQGLFEDWADGRLEGRTIVLLVSEANASSSYVQEIREVLDHSGATTVKITVKEPSFGIRNPALLERMQRIVAPVVGQRYEDTIAKRLVDEWTYVYPLIEYKPQEPGDEDEESGIFGSPIENENQEASTLEDGDDDDSEQGVNSNQIISQIDLEQQVQSHYPLTRFMLFNGIISIEVDYRSLLESHPAPPREQGLALHYVSTAQMPYGVNGIINTLTFPSTSDNVAVDPVGLQITSEIEQRGLGRLLPYPTWLKADIKTLVGTKTVADGASYYAVLVNIDSAKSNMVSNALNRGISCVTMLADVSGGYSVIALLTGAQGGVYGQDRSSTDQFPLLPTDPTGLIPFAQ